MKPSPYAGDGRLLNTTAPSLLPPPSPRTPSSSSRSPAPRDSGRYIAINTRSIAMSRIEHRKTASFPWCSAMYAPMAGLQAHTRTTRHVRGAYQMEMRTQTTGANTVHTTVQTRLVIWQADLPSIVSRFAKKITSTKKKKHQQQQLNTETSFYTF